MMSNLPGGLKNEVTLVTEDRPLSLSDPTLDNLLLNQRYAILQRYSRTMHTASTKDSIDLRPISFTTQVVSGTNYYVKLEIVHVGLGHHGLGHGHPKEYIHIRIFYQPWTQTTQLTGLLVGKTIDDKFSYDSFGDQSFEDVTLSETGEKRADHHQQLEDATAHTAPHVNIR
ncbi:hypothetical protein CPC16_011307 [Podila verticillata]|nr:hypothetical protein CPC16_011307 [Podila verticillata]